jgi:ubiquinone/menaquinone biosynthesis C-methylase UbiE
MTHPQTDIAEARAAAAFSRQAPNFDAIYGADPIVHYKRGRVRAHVGRHLPSGSQVLELNCGTGEDALYFAGLGHRVLATDVSEAMLQQFKAKRAASEHADRVELCACSYLELEQLQGTSPVDMVFSNFGGLNCTGRLRDVLAGCDALLRPGGLITLVVLPPFCLWESLLLLKGEWGTATRRWFARRGAPAQVEGQSFRCWYYSPVFIREALGDRFELLELEGLCTLVPPSYRENFPRRFPKLLRWLQGLEDRWAHRWPWRSIGDYYIMTLRKKEAP